MKEEEEPDYAVERELCSVSAEELKKLNKLREKVREELQELIEKRRLSKQQRWILIDDRNKECRRKRAKFDFNKAKRVSCAKNVLAEGNSFNFVYRGIYRNIQLVAAKVGRFIRTPIDSEDTQNFLSSLDYPAVVDIVFQE